MPFDFSDDPAQAHHAGLILANVPQGRHYETPHPAWSEFQRGSAPGQTAAQGAETVDLSRMGTVRSLSTVLGPREERLQNSAPEWGTPFQAKKAVGEAKAGDSSTLLYSILSSIIVLVEAGGKTMLLTGDARPTIFNEGMAAPGRCRQGAFHCDL